MTNLRGGTRKGQKFFKYIETYVVSDNYFRSIAGLPPAPYLECQPSQAALEQNSVEYLTALAQPEVNSVNRLLEHSEMYQYRNATSNTLTLPAPQGTTSPVTTASGFHPIGGTPLVTQAAQSTEVSNTQALNLLDVTSYDRFYHLETDTHPLDRPMYGSTWFQCILDTRTACYTS